MSGGRLAAACGAGQVLTVIISDVIGDPLDVIASGPTVPDAATPEDARRVLEKFSFPRGPVWDCLEPATPSCQSPLPTLTNVVIGNNAVAVNAAGLEAERLGYTPVLHAATELEGSAEDVGRHLLRMGARMQPEGLSNCLITGGEPTVNLVDEAQRGLGGRNQQLVLAALIDAQNAGWTFEHLALLSGGTDGEDGPTDAAGAIVDQRVAQLAKQKRLDPLTFLLRNDAYHFFAETDGLIKTGPTHTNVCDVRVLLVA